MKSNSTPYNELVKRIREFIAGKHPDGTIPLTISNLDLAALLHVVHDIGGQPDGPIDQTTHKPALWEKRTHCTAECLAWRGVWVAEERRRRENDLGGALYFGTPYYARWLLAATKMLLDKGLITPDELMTKMEEVARRENGLNE